MEMQVNCEVIEILKPTDSDLSLSGIFGQWQSPRALEVETNPIRFKVYSPGCSFPDRCRTCGLRLSLLSISLFGEDYRWVKEKGEIHLPIPEGLEINSENVAKYLQDLLNKSQILRWVISPVTV